MLEGARTFREGGHIYLEDNKGLWLRKPEDAPPAASFEFVGFYEVPPHIRKQSRGGTNAM